MIYTVTLNPSVDYVIHIDKITAGVVNRTEKEELYFGGKGINVSLILAELGIESTALGFTAGFTGAAIENYLKTQGIKTDFIRLDNGFSRINVKIKSGEETEINGRGADISENKLNEFFSKIDTLSDGDTLVLSGSVPKSLPDNIYECILKRISNKNMRTFVDAEKNLLIDTLKYKPFLIKPNQAEIEDIFGKKLEKTTDILECAVQLKAMGAVSVLVSRAGDEAVFVDADGESHILRPCTGELKNSVGAGDSMLAGFIAGCQLSNDDYDYAFKLGLSAGSATAFSDGLAKKDDIFKLFNSFYS